MSPNLIISFDDRPGREKQINILVHNFGFIIFASSSGAVSEFIALPRISFHDFHVLMFFVRVPLITAVPKAAIFHVDKLQISPITQQCQIAPDE